MDGDFTVGVHGLAPQVELWLESGGPITEAETERAVADVRGAVDRATRALVSDDGETLLVVRAQGISRTASRRTGQRVARVGAIALAALAVVGMLIGGALPPLGDLVEDPAKAPLARAPFPGPPRFRVADERDERIAAPLPKPVALHLPPPRVLDIEGRRFFDKDFTRLELLVVDLDSGEPTWVKVVEGEVDPRDAAAVKRLLAKAVDDPVGWKRSGSPAP
jgi:hypothetical protein